MPFPKIACALLLAATAAFAAEPTEVVPLWSNGAPGFENRKDEPEKAESYWVKNIHNPSLTVFLPPKEKGTGTAIIVCPGGGHRELVFKAEGVEAAGFLNDLGVAVFVLKYRLAREPGSPYSIEQHAREDGQRALRLVRSRAAEWNLATNRIGIMGFSAGGEVASLVSYASGEADATAADPIGRTSARPDFQIMIYPGPLGIPETIPSDAPPAFFLAANDDNQPARTITALLPKYRAAKVPMETHLFAKGGHAFNMGTRSKLTTLKSWPKRLADWLADNDLLPATTAETN
jgi:acetyl esterase/lipase